MNQPLLRGFSLSTKEIQRAAMAVSDMNQPLLRGFSLGSKENPKSSYSSFRHESAIIERIFTEQQGNPWITLRMKAAMVKGTVSRDFENSFIHISKE